MSTINWVSMTDRPPKRKRAELACEYCHSKKIKCDLLARSATGQSECSNCVTGSRECRTRPSRRPNRTRCPAKSSAVENSSEGRDVVTRSFTFVEGGGIELAGSANLSNIVMEKPTVALPTPPMLQPPHLALEHATDALTYQDLNEMSTGPSTNLSTSSPNTRFTESRVDQNYHADTGFLNVYGPENSHDARNQEQVSTRPREAIEELPDPSLQQGFIEAYLEYCYAWCPVIDRSSIAYETTNSSLLANALAVVGSHIKPPILNHTKPDIYYDRARKKFYEDEETDVLTSLKALSLFYWWSPRPPSTIHRHSSWWWQSVIIRHCQQMGYHREPDPDHAVRMKLDLSIRRRIWWTAFARERLTAICQSRPCIIDPDDCNVEELTLDDFPDTEKAKGEIFIYWVRLCAIIGKIAKHISRSFGSSTPFPANLAQELIQWVNSLPAHLQLPIHSNHTVSFNRDAHQLHLPYLAVVIILHLKKSSQPLPQAYPPAVLAATCIARIFKDILARGDTRFLMAITCWYTGTAYMALQQACRVEDLAKSANDDLDILTIMIDQLRVMWPTGNIFYKGFQRLRSDAASTATDQSHRNRHQRVDEEISTDNYDGGGIVWTAYFPFASTQTSNIAAKLLAPDPLMDELFPHDTYPDGMDLDFGTFFEPFGNFGDLDLCS